MIAALLFVGPGCPHCATVKRGLDELAREGIIAGVEIVDASAQPSRAAEYDVRSVPWLRLGPFTLTGAHGMAELRRWAEWAGGDEGIAHYVEHLLKSGEFKQATAFVAEDRHRLEVLLEMLADTNLGIDVRLGVSALLERYSGRDELRKLLPRLAELTRDADHRVRADACHLLGLSGDAAARAPVGVCLADESAEVREIAAEAMERLAATGENDAAG